VAVDSAADTLLIGGSGTPHSSSTKANYYNRFEVTLRKPSGTTKYDHLGVDFNILSTTDTLVLDDIALWESDAPCTDSDLDLGGPTDISLGEIPYGTKYDYSLQVQNRGCRDVTVYSLRTVAGTTVRDSLTYNKTVPFTLSKTEAITVSGKSHVAPGANQTRNFYINVLFGPSQVGPTRLLQIPLSYTTSE
jgi:hypothetical protein